MRKVNGFKLAALPFTEPFVKSSLRFVVAILLFASAGTAIAQPGTLDTTFSSNGFAVAPPGDCSSSAIQKDGKIVLGGNAPFIGGPSRIQLARYTQEGKLDKTFGDNGIVIFGLSNLGLSCTEIAIQTDGKIVAVGAIGLTDGSDFDFAVFRFNNDGSLDNTFGNQGFVRTPVIGAKDFATSVAIQTDGKIVVAGDAGEGIQFQCFAVARYNVNGSLDKGFGDSGIATRNYFTVGSSYDECSSVAIQGDGKIITAGYTSPYRGHYFALIRYNTNGSLDLTFDADGKVTTDFDPLAAYSSSMARDVLVQPDGKIIAAGSTNVSSFALVRYNNNGSLDLSFDGDGKVVTPSIGEISAAALQANGKIVATGSGYRECSLARYNSNGSLDYGFGINGLVTKRTGGLVYPSSIQVQQGGNIIVAGTSIVSNISCFVARFQGDAVNPWSTVRLRNNQLPNQSTIQLSPNPSPGTITLTYNGNISGNIQLQVFDKTGKVMFSKTENAVVGKNTFQLNLSHLINGVYELRVSNGREQTQTKLVIEK